MQNKKTKIFSIVLSVLVSAMLVAGAVMAATTISENIATGGTLTVTGASTLTGALAANGGVTVDTTNFTVNGTTGAVHTAGDFDVATTMFTVASASGNTVVAGTLDVTGAITGALTGNVTGNVSGTAATVTGAAQAAITSLGTLTTLTVDDITINGNTISSAGASTLAITPTAGQTITFDGTVTLDAGVIAGATSITSTAFVGALTGNASTATSATSATSATTAANLAGGLANQIAYQTGAGTTGFLTAGTDGQLLVANAGGLPVFVTMSGDVTTSNAGVTAIGALKVTNAMLAGLIDLTAKVTGVLPTANGGTGIAYFTAAGPTVARVYTFPDAAATIARTDAGQTFTGVQTMTSPVFTTPAIGAATGASLVLTGAVTAGTNVISSVADTLTAGGTTQADALALTADYNNVTVGAIATGVKLPVAVAGMDITVRNSVANTIHIYSAAAETLNGTAGSTGLNLDASLGTRCVAMSTSVWLCNKIGAIED